MTDVRSDRIEIRGLELLVYCGVLPEEQARRQPFLFDLDLHLDLTLAGTSDDLDHTADYGHLIDVLAGALADERFQLLERMAARVAELLFEHSSIDAVTVTARKLRPPVAAHVDTTGVRIHRSRPGGGGGSA
ncbi:MAG: dihydroneopterin aldolase [Actinomycetota bacterium]